MKYIINIHGYNGKKENNIYRSLIKMDFDNNIHIMSIQLTNSPINDYNSLLNLIKSLNGPTIITSKSLGSFYGCIFNGYFDIPCICFNPSFNPLINISFNKDDEDFIIKHNYNFFDFNRNITCYISKEDKRIDQVKQFQDFKFLKYTDNIVLSNYNHDFDGIEYDIDLLNQFKNKILFYFNEIDKFNIDSIDY